MKSSQASKQKESQSRKSAVKVLALSLMAVSLAVVTAFVYSNYTEGSAQVVPTRPAAAGQFQAGGQTEPAPQEAVKANSVPEGRSQAGQAAEGHRNREPGSLIEPAMPAEPGSLVEPAEPASRAGRSAQPDWAGETSGAPASKVVPQDLCSLGLQQSPMIRVSYNISTMPTCLKKMLSLDYLVLPNDETPQDLSGFSASSSNSVSV